MTPRTARRDGWLWPAVLVVSVVLLLSAGHRLLAVPNVAADVPVSTVVEDPRTPPASPSPTPTAGTERAAGPRWPTRPAGPRPAPKVVPPERLVARSVGLDLPVVPQGVDEHGQMAHPARPGELGWYRFGPTPSDRRGAVVLAGHVDSDRYGTGPLVRAAQLRKGARIDVRDRSGRTTAYEVVAVQRIRKSDFSPDDVFARSGKPVLRLITCGGAYEPRRGGYQDNLVVTAERR